MLPGDGWSTSEVEAVVKAGRRATSSKLNLSEFLASWLLLGCKWCNIYEEKQHSFSLNLDEEFW